MRMAARVVITVIGVTALFATAIFAGMTLLPNPRAMKAARFAEAAKPPLAFAAGALLAPAELPVPVQLAQPEPAPAEAPLVFDHPGSSLAADAVVGSVPVFANPGAPAPTRTLSNPTIEGVPLVFGVVQRSGDWLRVRLPVRPNGSTGWVRASDVSVRSVSNHIIVEVSKRKLSAFNGTQLLMEAPVGVGTARTPTPTGTFYVDISVKNPGGPYGRHMLSVAGFSNVLETFGRGVGQVAIHGTNNAGSVGQFSSNGCMRLTNEAVLQLAGLAPTGTPVYILP